MRIIIDATAALSGGKVYLVNLLPHLALLAPEHEFIVFHTADLDVSSLQIPTPNFTFHATPLPPSNEQNWLWVSLLKVFWRLIIFPFHLWRLRPDVIFSNTGFGPLWRPSGAKLVLALHNAVPFLVELQHQEHSLLRRLRLAGLQWLISATLRRGDQPIVFSEELKRLVTTHNRKLANAVVIHHGIDWGASDRKALIEPSLLSGYGIRQPYLLYVSQFHRYKNVPRLLEAFALARRTLRPYSDELLLVLIGKPTDNEYEQEITRVVVSLDLQNCVKFIPGIRREKLKPFYRSALALVYPSLIENCPFAVLEALAFGLPIAVSRCSALPEMAGEAAIYFDPYDVNEMAEAMERLVWDEQLRDALSGKAIQQAAKFTWERAARQTLEVFENVVQSEPSTGSETHAT